MVQEAPAYHRPPPESSKSLRELLGSGSHLLTKGDDGIAQTALAVSKDLFELGLALESHSHVHLHPFLKSILEPPAFTTRASAKKAAAAAKDAPAPENLLPYTPLGELTTEGMDPEQIWAQLEMRNEGIGKVVKEVGVGETGADGLEMDEDEDGESEDDEEDGSDEEMSVEEFKKMMMEEGIDDEDEDGSGGDSEDDEVHFRDEEVDSDLSEEDDDEDEEDEDEDEDDEEDEEDDEESESDELEETEEDFSFAGDEDEYDGEGMMSEEEDDANELFGQPGPSRRPRHPTLDDQFFSIDEFNRLTEEAEAGRISTGRLGGDDGEEDEELGDIGDLMLRGAAEEDEIMYGDFFEAPRRASAGSSRGDGATSSKKKKREAKKAKRKGKGVRFGSDKEEEDEDMLDDESVEEEEEYSRMGRVKGDLFDDEDEEEEPQNLSTHEKRQLALQKQIAELETQAIGPKDWQLLGEATSKARPENSLLEENLDFEHAGKIVPVITEDTVKTLEELIKRRIIDNNFDSPVRVRAYEPTPFLPSRYFELQDTQSSKSLAQIYEEEYQAAATGGKVVDARDEKLKKEHEEIEKIWGEICYKLDALSSLNFVPKQPKASITTISNLPTTSMESALPPTAAADTMLAPEELFQPPTASTLVARSELTPEEAQKARGKARKLKATHNKRLSDAVDLYSKKKKSAKAEKEEALKGLVKSGKGVTVVGKSDKEKGKAIKRSGGDAAREDSKRLKL